MDQLDSSRTLTPERQRPKSLPSERQSTVVVLARSVMKFVFRAMKRPAKWLLPIVLPLTTFRLLRFLRKAQWRVEQLERNMQRITALMLYDRYRDMAPECHPKSVINRYELSVYSQNGEDGILLYIFSQVGTTNRCFVEFGVEDGRECNSANLAINFGWRGLLMEMDEFDTLSAREYYDAMLGARRDEVKIVQRTITPENINQTLLENQVVPEPDLFSIDIDSNDYWVWKAIDVVRPRVMVVEYNPVYGPERSLTIPYQPGLNRFTRHYSGFYFGASLTALTKLAHEKGYALVGCDSTGTNAFFVRKDVLAGTLQALTPQQAFYRSLHYYSDVHQDGRLNPPEQFTYIQHLDFVEIP